MKTWPECRSEALTLLFEEDLEWDKREDSIPDGIWMVGLFEAHCGTHHATWKEGVWTLECTVKGGETNDEDLRR